MDSIFSALGWASLFQVEKEISPFFRQWGWDCNPFTFSVSFRKILVGFSSKQNVLKSWQACFLLDLSSQENDSLAFNRKYFCFSLTVFWAAFSLKQKEYLLCLLEWKVWDTFYSHRQSNWLCIVWGDGVISSLILLAFFSQNRSNEMWNTKLIYF